MHRDLHTNSTYKIMLNSVSCTTSLYGAGAELCMVVGRCGGWGRGDLCKPKQCVLHACDQARHSSSDMMADGTS